MIIDRVRESWRSPIYGFFEAEPEVEWRTVQPRDRGAMQRKRYLKFKCVAPHCKGRTRFVYRATFGSDKSSTSNLRVHAESCWGKETLEASSKVEGGVAATRDLLKGRNNNLRDGTLLSAFKQKAKTKIDYLLRPPMKSEIKANHVLWIVQSNRPPEMVKDPGYLKNMRDGRPHAWIPSPSTVRRDVRMAFAGCRQKIYDYLKVC